MPNGLPTFQVVALALERADLINRFATYHLGVGAKRVVIYHDGPLDPGLHHGNNIQHFVADDGFWASLGITRPEDSNQRQRAVYGHAAEQAEVDWTFPLDIDEFLVAPTPLAQSLSRIPASDLALRIRNEEAVWGPGDRLGSTLGATWFRTPMRPGRARRLLRLLHGRQGDLLRMGVTAYGHGKHLVRNRAGVSVGIHFSRHNGEECGVWLHEVCPDMQDTFIAHFDAVDFDHWQVKWQRRRGSPWARRISTGARHTIMMAAICDALDADDDLRSARRLFATLHAANRWQAMCLRLVGKLRKRQVFRDQSTGAPYYGD